MTTRPKKRIRRTEEQWRELVSRFETGRIDAATFCKNESLSLSSLQRWLRHFRSTDHFAELPVPEPTASTTSWAVEVELPDGIV